MAEMSAQNNTEEFSSDSDAAEESSTVEWDRDGENTPVFAVVSAVADAAGEDPFELPPLARAIDPEALNDLFLTRPGAGVDAVTFEYTGYDVTVRGEGTVRVQPRGDD